MADTNGDAREAQLAKLAKEQREQRSNAARVIWQLRALLAKANVDVPEDIDRQCIGWLAKDQEFER